MARTLEQLLEDADPEVLAEAEKIYKELREEYDQKKCDEQENHNS